MTLAATVDEFLDRPAVVFGSLPGMGGDLDLLVEPTGMAAVETSLEAAGFVALDSLGRRWYRRAADGGWLVEIHSADGWDLPPEEARALFRDGRRIQPFALLLRPAPRHAVLIAARRLAGGERRWSKLARRVNAALDEDPAAFELAEPLAESWGVVPALRLLRRTYGSGEAPTTLQTIAVVYRRRRFGSDGRLEAAYQALRAFAPKRGRIVAFSGLDGSGKTLQAHALREALAVSGWPASVVWTRIGQNRSLDVIALPVKQLIGRCALGTRAGRTDADRPERIGAEIRLRNPMLTYVWTCVVGLVNALSHVRATMPHVARGRIAICDRYVLDSVAHLRFRYGGRRSFRLARWLIRVVSPRPTRAFFLDVDGAEAHRRKPERYTVGQLEQLAAIYRDEYRATGATRIDGARPAEDIHIALVRAVWRALRS